MKFLAAAHEVKIHCRDNSVYPVNTRKMEDRERRNLGYLAADAGTCTCTFAIRNAGAKFERVLHGGREIVPEQKPS